MKWLDKLLKNPPYWRQFAAARSNFVYQKDTNDEYKRYSSIKHRFVGDCEDFAFTLQLKIGGKVVYVSDYKTKGGHAVLLNDGWVYCNQMDKPVKLEDYDLGKVYPDSELKFTDKACRWEIDNDR